MYKNEFLPYISSVKSSHFILFGSCDTSVDYYSHLLAKYYCMDEILKIDFEEYDFLRCRDFLGLDSIFNETKLLFIRANKLCPVKELGQLIELCNDNKKMIISLYGVNSLQDISKYTKNFVRFFAPSSTYEAVNFLSQIALSKNINLERLEIQTIYESLNQDLFLTYCELEKYKNFKPTLNFIKAQCGSEFDIDFELFFDDFINTKNIEKNISSFLFFSQVNEVYALNMISNQFIKIFKIKLGIKNNLSPQEILGYNPPKDVLARLLKWVDMIEIDMFDKIISLLLQCERELKIEQKELKREVLFSYLIKILFVLQKD